MQYIAFDLETTGFLPGVDQIVEIGAVRFDDGVPISKFCTLINPRRNMPEAASRVSGITDDMLVGQPFVENVLESFADFCGGDILVAHNAAFDYGFLNSDILKHEAKAATGPILDTLSMCRKIVPGLANYKLGTLVQYFELTSNEFHRAEADAGYCGNIFWKLIQRVYQSSTPAIENLIALSNNQALKFPIIEKKPKQLSLLEL
jgi:DNA polymerase III subunit epsilon